MRMRKNIGKYVTPWGRQCMSQMILLGKSLDLLSAEIGLSPNYISAMINGRVAVTDENREKINTALQITNKQMVG